MPRRQVYESYNDAAMAARTLGFTTKEQYRAGYKQDPKLHSTPERRYSKEGWKGWQRFLTGKMKPCYTLYEEASAAAQALNITSKAQYAKHHPQDPLLPTRPDVRYNWRGWDHFLGVKRTEREEDES